MKWKNEQVDARRPRTASKPVKLQRPGPGRRVQSLPERTWPPASCQRETSALIRAARIRENVYCSGFYSAIAPSNIQEQVRPTTALIDASNNSHDDVRLASRVAARARRPGCLYRLDRNSRRSLSRAASILSERKYTGAIFRPPEILLSIHL